ncbi:MAG: hypothetical protein M3296_11245 [Actinomycetota bacterium]|nr:hypothetical protein [Actinomycetota bacterium]
MTIAADRRTRDRDDPLIRTANSLVLNVVISSALGFGFWIAAARSLPSTAVGRDSALVAAMVALSSICQLNLAAGIHRFLRVTRLSPARVIVGAYGASGMVALLGATAFVLIAPALSSEFGFLREREWLAPLFVAAVVLWGVFNLQDAALTALRRAPWVPIENATFGILKIALLPPLIATGVVHSIFIAWMIPMVLLLIPMNFLLFARAVPQRPPRGAGASPVERFGRRGLARFLAQDYVGTIFMLTTMTVLPLVVVATIGSSAGAHFYMPFMIITAFDLIFVNIASSVTVEGGAAGGEFPLLVRRVVRRFGAMLAGGVAVLAVGAPLILLPFGASYAEAGAPVLRLLACASAARAVVGLYVAVCRIEGRSMRILEIQALTLAGVMTLTVLLGGAHGITGVAMGWLLANGLAVCLVLRRVIVVLRLANRLAHDLEQPHHVVR